MARRSEHSQDQIKEMVLQAAEIIVSEEGVEALTVRKIAQEVGYTVGSIYMVFANMQDLHWHIKGRSLDQLASQLQAASQGDNVAHMISTLAHSYLNFATENFNRWCILFETNSLNTTTSPDWYQQKIELMFAPIEALFRRLSTDMNEEQAKLAARTLWCGIHGVCVLSLPGNLSGAGIKNTELSVHMLVENFIQGWH